MKSRKRLRKCCTCAQLKDELVAIQYSIYIVDAARSSAEEAL